MKYKHVKKLDYLKAVIGILGDKWTGLIVRELSQDPLRFNQLYRNLNSISPRTLSDRLTILTLQKIIKKKKFNSHFQYMLTPKGMDLLPILKSMSRWGQKYYSD